MKLTEEELLGFVGTKCGKLTVSKYLGYFARNGVTKRHWYECKCDCGNTTIVDRSHLNINVSSRAVTSCGCSRNIHGYYKHPAYNNYKSMMGRVHHPHPNKHKNYILNNIKICPEWDGHPDVFCKWADEHGYQKGLTLDRIDSYGDYCPENCRWTTPLVQSNNRPSYNHNITFNGKTQSLAAWARELDMPVGTLDSRINYCNMTLEEALTKPVNLKFSRTRRNQVLD